MAETELPLRIMLFAMLATTNAYFTGDSPAQVDLGAVITSNKVLTCIFVGLIIIANVSLLFTIHNNRPQGQKTTFGNSQRKFIIFTLIIGDVLGAALFLGYFGISLAFGDMTISSRGNDFTITCSDKKQKDVFLYFYMPFVYGFALITLCYELVFRRSLRSTFKSPCCASLLLTAVPWVLGLVVVLPLMYVGFDTDTCRYDSSWTESRQKASFIIALVVPPTLALIVALVSSTRSFDTLSEHYSAESTTAADIAVHFTTSSGGPNGKSTPDSTVYSTGYPQFQPYHQSGSNQPQPAFASSVPPPPYSGLQPTAPPSPYYPEFQAPPTYFPNTVNQQYPPPQGSVTIQTPQLQAQTSPAASLDQSVIAAAVKVELRALVNVAIVNLLLTAPYGLFVVCYLLKRDARSLDPVPEMVVSLTLQWMVILRAVITPLVWRSAF